MQRTEVLISASTFTTDSSPVENNSIVLKRNCNALKTLACLRYIESSGHVLLLELCCMRIHAIGPEL